MAAPTAACSVSRVSPGRDPRRSRSARPASKGGHKVSRSSKGRTARLNHKAATDLLRR